MLNLMPVRQNFDASVTKSAATLPAVKTLVAITDLNGLQTRVSRSHFVSSLHMSTWWNDMGRHPKFLTPGASSFQLVHDISWHRALRALIGVWPFQVTIEMRHQARGPRSLPPDLPDLGHRIGTLTPCLLILTVWPFRYTATSSKQCSRQLQCEVPCCVGNVINSSLFINSSLSSLSSTSHAVQWGWWSCLWQGVRGLGGRGAGDKSVQLPYILHYHMVLRPEGTSHNNLEGLLVPHGSR